MMSKDRTDPEQKKVIQLYSAFGASLVLTLVPSAIVALFAIVLFLGVMIAAHAMRKNGEKGNLAENHATFIIRTIWIGSFFAMVTLSAACAYMLANINNDPLQPCAQNMLASASAISQNQDVTALINIIKPCLEPFISANMQIFMVAMAITAGPVLLYFIVRFSRGLSRAVNGYRVSKPKSWF